MNVAIGFGSTEQAFEAAEEQAIREHIEQRYSELALDYFTDAFVKEISEWVKERGAELRAVSVRYKNAADYPSRYSEYWPIVISDASHIVVILTILHVNRRHGLSPDGWATMRSKPVFLFEATDMQVSA